MIAPPLPTAAVTARQLALLPRELREAVLADMPAGEIEVLHHTWAFWARPDQLPPAGDWRTWLLLGGRGSGKTRSAAEWCRAEIEGGRRRQLGIIGPTADSLRRVQVEGPSGILAIAPPWCRPEYEPSRRLVRWPNGAVAHLFSAEEPDRLRGPNLDGAWADELTSWPDAAAMFDMLSMALRLPGPQGHAPQVVISTTPKPLPVLKAIMAAPSTVITRARTYDNAANLDPSTLRYLTEKYGGTSLGRQELDAEMIEDAEGALWNRALIDAGRITAAQAPGTYKRVVVAIDPSGGGGKRNDEAGILVCGLGPDHHAYVLQDLSGKFSPDRWARRAVEAYQAHRADRIVAESNFGAAMVEQTIHSVDPNVPVKLVHASRGKQVRAEPIVALYEQNKVHHVGDHLKLEDELCGWEPTGSQPSPGRLDALVWCLSELMLGEKAAPARFISHNEAYRRYGFTMAR